MDENVYMEEGERKMSNQMSNKKNGKILRQKKKKHPAFDIALIRFLRYVNDIYQLPL